ncbi:NAD(P)-dependent oxidoreductase [Kitasatospora viridis]|uniref:Putative NADH-flavin reductase n=1 Tax=Kitasatospora viridis TaxID=281105 RepID=A0A561SEK3_9ACTN|nr:NAD(P)H-binding protein [Kitasatospora viridis]TWF73291.1 putative NADH-flavin reductase [Kitasatospora viridis]
MRLTVLGATGGIGRHLVTQALADGHQVTAVVRDPDRLALRQPELTVVRADALDPNELVGVVEGADAVLSGVGQAGRHDRLRPASTSARAAVAAMAATGVQRIVVVSAATLNRAGTGQPLLARRVAAPLLWAVFGELYTDLEAMERILRAADPEWTAVRPARLTNGPGLGRYRHAVETGPPGASIARADVARAMLDFLTAPHTVRHAVAVSR